MKWSSAPYNSSVYVLESLHKVHSIPEMSLPHRMPLFPPVSQRRGKLQLRHSETSNRSRSRVHGSERRSKMNLSWGQQVEDGLSWRPPFTYTIACIQEPYNFFFSFFFFTRPLEAGGRKVGFARNRSIPRPSLLPRLAWPCRQAGRLAGRPTGEERVSFYLVGIFALFRAIASSTAFSCFSSSSRRDSVLLGLLEPEPTAEVEPGAGGLPDGAAGPFPDDLGGGDRGRFLRKGSRSRGTYIYSDRQIVWHD